MSVSGIGSSLTTLERLLEQARHTSTKKSASAATTVDETSSGSFAAALQGASQTGTVASAAADTTSLRSKVDAAVKAAIENFDTSTGSVSDLLATIRKTVDEPLKANGVEPRSAQGQPSGPPPSGPPPSGGAKGSSQEDALAELLGTASTDETSTTAAEDLKQALLDLLAGKTDSASTSAATTSTGSTDFESILKSAFAAMPNGSQVDLKA